MGPGSQSEEVRNHGTMDSQALRPLVLVEGPPQGCRLVLRGRDDHESEATGAHEGTKLGELSAFVEISRTFAGDVRGRAAEIDADQFQNAVRVPAMGGGDLRPGQPRTKLLHFLAGQPRARRLTTGRIDQHGILHWQRLWSQRNRALTGQSERLSTRHPQHVIRRGMDKRVLAELVLPAQPIEQFARRVARQAGQHSASQDVVGGQSVPGHVLDDLTVSFLGCCCLRGESLGHGPYHN